MAFSCKSDNDTIYSFQYDPKDWIALKENKESVFEMTCCGNQAILKTSKLGTQFFAHKVKPKHTNCSTGGESAEHIHIKYLVMKELDRNGWAVEVEKRGFTPNGEEWIADIYAEKGRAKIVIEVQWSPQSFIEIKRRQQAYKDSGIRGAWLLRSGSANRRNAIVGDFMYSTKHLPVFSIYKNKGVSNNSYEVCNINKINANQGLTYKPLIPIQLELSCFIEKLVSSKIKFDLESSVTSQLSLDIMKMDCLACGKVTETVVSVNVRSTDTAYGIERSSNSYNTPVDQCSKKTIDFVNANFSQMYGFAPLRNRYSENKGDSYIANSCTHCDALMGRNYLKSWRGYFSRTLFETNKVIMSKEENMKLSFGRWVLID